MNGHTLHNSIRMFFELEKNGMVIATIYDIAQHEVIVTIDLVTHLMCLLLSLYDEAEWEIYLIIIECCLMV